MKKLISYVVQFFPYLIIIFSTLSFILLKSDFTAFEPNTHSFIPALELKNEIDTDFYTSSIFKSPKIIIAYLINFFFFDWYYGIYFFKIFLILLLYVSIWFLYVSIIIHKLRVHNICINFKFYLFIALFFIFFIAGIFGFFQGAGSRQGPLGYGSIHYSNDFNAMFLSFVLGVYAIIYAFNKNEINNPISIIIIFISTIIHPAMGINNVIFLFLFYAEKLDILIIKKFLTFSLYSIIIPILILKFNFPSDSNLSGKDFFDIYVSYRHPHHYLVSDKIFKIPLISIDHLGDIKIKIVNLSSFILWSIFLTSQLIFSYFYTKKIFFLNLMIFCIFHLIALIQYLFVEIFHIKLFIELGITRFTTLLSIIFLIQLVLNLIFLTSNNNESKLMNKNYKYNFKFDILKSIFLVLIIAIIITNVTYVHPLNDSSFNKYHAITKWVNKNIDDKKEFIIKNQNDFNIIQFLRVFGKQNIFYDKESFPFASQYIKEYSNRLHAHKKILEHLQNGNTLKINKNYKDLIGYLLVEKEKNMSKKNDKNIIYEDEFYVIKILRLN